MPEFRVTFGQQYGSEAYGCPPHPRLGYRYAHKDGWVTVVAPDERTARDLVVTMVGTAWSFLYGPEEVEQRSDWDLLFPRGELLRITEPEPEPGQRPAHLLIGSPPAELQSMERPGDLLVTVWPDGTGEVAYRHDPRHTWGPPLQLTPAPGQPL